MIRGCEELFEIGNKPCGDDIGSEKRRCSLIKANIGMCELHVDRCLKILLHRVNSDCAQPYP